MKHAVLPVAVSLVLSGCLATPERSERLEFTDKQIYEQGGAQILVSGFVPNKSLPIVVRCEKDTVYEIGRIVPSQSPTLDKNAKAIYAFSGTLNVPYGCFQFMDSPIYVDPEHGNWNYRAMVEWSFATLAYGQEVTRSNGTKYLSFQNVVLPETGAAQCATKQYTTKATWASVLNNCSRFVDWSSNGRQFLMTAYRTY